MRKLQIAATTILTVLIMTAGAFANDPEVKIAIENLGYYIESGAAPDLSDWEVNDFRMIEKREYAIRRNKRVPGKPAGYYRFTVKVEVYASEFDAEARVENLDATPPGPESRRTAPEFDWRYGFRIGTKVYVLSTDTYAHVEDGTLGSVASKFEEWVIDAGT